MVFSVEVFPVLKSANFTNAVNGEKISVFYDFLLVFQ